MKSIAQLLELSSNPYYAFTPEERQLLDDFLETQSRASTQQKTSSDDSEKNIPATVINKNVVKKETGIIPLANNDVAAAKGLGQSQGTPTTL